MDLSAITDLNRVKEVEIAQNKMFNLIRNNLKQEKGQRIFRPFWNDIHISRPNEIGCEIFVGRLPRDAFEDELIPLFGSLGQIYESRLMMDFSGLTRGFCYVTYTTREMADAAVKYLHGLRIRPNGDKICCYRSLDNRRLYLEGLPTHKSIDEIERALVKVLPGVRKVILYTNPQKHRVNLGVGFVEFVDHRHAANCRKQLWPARLNIWNSTVHVEWAVPLPQYTDHTLLLIKNLGVNITKAMLVNELLKHFTDNTSIVNIYRRGTYAIVQFLLKKDAIAALHLFKGRIIDGNVVIPKIIDTEKELILDVQLCEWYESSNVDLDLQYNEVEYNVWCEPTENKGDLFRSVFNKTPNNAATNTFFPMQFTGPNNSGEPKPTYLWKQQETIEPNKFPFESSLGYLFYNETTWETLVMGSKVFTFFGWLVSLKYLH